MRDVLHQLQFLLNILLGDLRRISTRKKGSLSAAQIVDLGGGENLVALDVRSEAALRRETDTLLLRVSEDLGSFVNASLDLLRILEFRKLGADQSENNSLILGQ